MTIGVFEAVAFAVVWTASVIGLVVRAVRDRIRRRRRPLLDVLGDMWLSIERARLR